MESDRHPKEAPKAESPAFPSLVASVAPNSGETGEFKVFRGTLRLSRNRQCA